MKGVAVSCYKYVDTILSPWVLVGTGDFDGEGQADLLWQNASTGDVYAGIMNGAKVVMYRYIDSVGAPFEIALWLI